MTIAIGDKLPDATFKTMTPDGAKDMTTSEIFAGKRVVLFGVPGAFTPTCSNNHLPGYLENHDAILAKGVDTIAVVAVNDHHVMGAWARFTGGEGKILYLADGNGAFAKATGLDGDMSGGGHGPAHQALLDDRRRRQGDDAQRRDQARGERVRCGDDPGAALSKSDDERSRPSSGCRPPSPRRTGRSVAVTAAFS